MRQSDEPADYDTTDAAECCKQQGLAKELNADVAFARTKRSPESDSVRPSSRPRRYDQYQFATR